MTEVKRVSSGSVVAVEYTGTLDSGTVFDSSKGRQPLAFTAGKGEVIKGFDDAVQDMKVGDTKSIKLTPEQAYGAHSEQLVQQVPKEAFPGNVEVKKGMMLQLRSPEGQMLLAKVVDVEEKSVTLDLNHPLAGQNLHFELKVVDIK